MLTLHRAASLTSRVGQLSSNVRPQKTRVSADMSNPNPWEPKPLLDDHPWSLIPNKKLPVGTARLLLAAWFAVVLLTTLFGSPFWMSLVAGAIAGAWAVHYVCARLGGRPATTGGASSPIRPDSPFQARLAFDILSVLVFATAVYLVSFKA